MANLTRGIQYMWAVNIYSQFYSPLEYKKGNIEIVSKKTTTKFLEIFMLHLSICHFSYTTVPVHNFLCPRALLYGKESSFHEFFAIMEMFFTFIFS